MSAEANDGAPLTCASLAAGASQRVVPVSPRLPALLTPASARWVTVVQLSKPVFNWRVSPRMASSGSQSSRSCCSSEALSSDASSSCASSEASPAGSPRGGAPTVPPLALNRRVPPLSLRANLADLPRDDGPGDAPGTGRRAQQQQQPEAVAAAQPRAVPRLAMPQLAGAEQLAQPQSARGAAPAPTGPATMAQLATAAPAAVGPQPPAGQAALLSLDILSPAFSLERPTTQQLGPDAAAATAQLSAGAADRLGVPPERLRYYALTEVAGPDQLPPGCPRAAVEVLDSRELLQSCVVQSIRSGTCKLRWQLCSCVVLGWRGCRWLLPSALPFHPICPYVHPARALLQPNIFQSASWHACRLLAGRAGAAAG